MTEDIGDLEAEIMAATNSRPTICSVCDWLTPRDDAERWDRIFAADRKTYGHKAIWQAMKDRGYVSESSKPIETHRQKKHRGE